MKGCSLALYGRPVPLSPPSTPPTFISHPRSCKHSEGKAEGGGSVPFFCKARKRGRARETEKEWGEISDFPPFLDPRSLFRTCRDPPRAGVYSLSLKSLAPRPPEVSLSRPISLGACGLAVRPRWPTRRAAAPGAGAGSGSGPGDSQ